MEENKPQAPDDTNAATRDGAPARTDARVTFGGGMQPGGGMVEPDEFDESTREPELPNDALAEGLRDRAAAPQAGGTVDPAAAPEGNDAGARMGDVGGFLGSDRVVGVDPSRAGGEPAPERSTGD
jgi:hypothetical protein